MSNEFVTGMTTQLRVSILYGEVPDLRASEEASITVFMSALLLFILESVPYKV